MGDCAIYIDFRDIIDSIARYCYGHLMPFGPFLGGANWIYRQEIPSYHMSKIHTGMV